MVEDVAVGRKVGPQKLESLLKHDYVGIRNHAAVFGDRTTLLVSATGEIDWGCLPYFDSDPVFFSILDSKRGGRFAVRPETRGVYATQRYEGDTGIVVTEFRKKGKKILTITDFIPINGDPGVYFSEIHRIVRANVSTKIKIVFEPFGTGSRKSLTSEPGKGYRVRHRGRVQYLATDAPMHETKEGFVGEISLQAGEEKHLVAEYGIWDIYNVDTYATVRRLEETQHFWQSWMSDFNYTGIYPDIVKRSAIALKGMFFAPTGLMTAAPTASLPESIGGGRQWDYRYMWLRDTTYVLDVLMRLGFRTEASKFLYSAVNKVQRKGKIETIYSVSNRRMMPEKVTNLDGYMHSKPVRFGNAASKQFQIDQYAALIISAHSLMKYGGTVNLHMLGVLETVAKKIMNSWDRPDNSIWEIRERKRHYVYSKVLAWRALKDMEDIMIKHDVNSKLLRDITNTAEAIKSTIDKHAISRKGGFYTQYFGGKGVDASLLRLPHLGYCSADSEIFRKTLKEIEKRLMKEDFLFIRYDADDGMGVDNAFLLMSFWYIEDLAMMGKLDRAREGLEGIVAQMNNVGLLPEELEFKTQDYLGNYPQALSHLGLILAIMRYNEYRKRAEGTT